MSSLPYTAYMASLAPPIAALSGAGIVLFWRWHRAGSWRTWVLPLAIVAEYAETHRAEQDGFRPRVLPQAHRLSARLAATC
jgi:hypothetical protein